MYNTGDRVYLLLDEPDGNICLHIGSLGTVLEDRNGDADPMDRVFVRWDERLEQSDDLNGYDDGHVWFVKKGSITLCPDEGEEDQQPCSDETLAAFIFGGEQK